MRGQLLILQVQFEHNIYLQILLNKSHTFSYLSLNQTSLCFRTIMKYFIRNYSEYKKLLNKASQKITPVDYPIFCMTLGYLFAKIEDFDLLYSTLEKALELVVQDKFPETQYFQWLLFLNENPHRLDQCIDFLNNISSDQLIDVIDQIEALFSSDRYQKRPLKAQNRYNSVDTVVMDNFNPEKQFDSYDGEKNALEDSFSMEMIQKMQEDQQMARKLQQEEEQLMKEYKSKMKQEQTVCEICYVDLYEGNPSFLDQCGHGFHQQCLTQTFKASISTNTFPLKCPNAQCGKQCLESDIKSILPQDLYKKYQNSTLKAYAELNGDSVSWCPTADCGYMFFYQKGDQPRFTCLECKKQYCLNCRCQWHKDMTCKEYKISNTMSEDDKKFLDFVAGKKYKQCPKCKFWVQKNQGCDHMTCKCKFQFCYKCGGVYMKCQCLAKQQQEMRRVAEARRVARQSAQKKKQQRALKKAEEMRLKAEKKGEQKNNRRGRSKKEDKK